MTLYACVCPADAGKSITCRSGSTRLQRGSGQVLVIDGGFYGRKKVYHCRLKRSWLAAPTPAQCGWVEVTKSLTGTKDHMILMSPFVLIKCSAEAQIRSSKC